MKTLVLISHVFIILACLAAPVQVPTAAAEALAKLGAPAVDILTEALSHPEAAVREIAANRADREMAMLAKQILSSS